MLLCVALQYSFFVRRCFPFLVQIQKKKKIACSSFLQTEVFFFMVHMFVIALGEQILTGYY